MSAPETGWPASSLANSWSAGGQLEHPSEVKSSTMTGARSTAALKLPSPSDMASDDKRNDTDENKGTDSRIRLNPIVFFMLKEIIRIIGRLKAIDPRHRWKPRLSTIVGAQSRWFI